MKFKFVTLLAWLGLCYPIFAGEWYTGVWDSNIYNRSEKPRTVGIRVEVLDAETEFPVPNVTVSLEGKYIQEIVRTAGGDDFIPRPPQEKEFELTTYTVISSFSLVV